MPTFHHHPDGHVILRGEGRPYRATLADFLADCQALDLPAYPGLPEGWSERIYDGQRDLLGRPDHRDDNPDPPGVLPAYLAAFDRLVAADIARDEGAAAAREHVAAEQRRVRDATNQRQREQHAAALEKAQKLITAENVKLRAKAATDAKDAIESFTAGRASEAPSAIPAAQKPPRRR